MWWKLPSLGVRVPVSKPSSEVSSSNIFIPPRVTSPDKASPFLKICQPSTSVEPDLISIDIIVVFVLVEVDL